MTSTPRRPRATPQMLRAAITANERALAEHPDAGRTLSDGEVESVAAELLRRMTAPAAESAGDARRRRLLEAADRTPDKEPHRMSHAELNAYAESVWHLVYDGPAA